MRYTITLDLADFPTWQRDTVTTTLDEHGAAWTHWGKGMLDVSGTDQAATERACTAALQRVGKRLVDVSIPLL